METKSNFILTDPPRGNSPRGHLTNNYQYHSPSRHHSDRLVSNSYQTHDINMDRNDYNNTKSAFLFASSKPRPHASSFSGSDASERSTKFFNYRQSPAHRSFITEDQVGRRGCTDHLGVGLQIDSLSLGKTETKRFYFPNISQQKLILQIRKMKNYQSWG